MNGLVLSLFPGIDLLGRAFEEEGFVVVRGPDPIMGGDIRDWHPPAGKFDGIVGGPPCQAHSTFAALNRSQGKCVAQDLVPEFVRCVREAAPGWFLMENVPNVPTITLNGYTVHRFRLCPRWLGHEQERKRDFQFGSVGGRRLDLAPSLTVLENMSKEPTCMASEGKSGRISNKRVDGRQRSRHNPRRPWPKFCELQGVPATFLEDAPWTVDGKYRAVGNGVPIPMGRAIARAVKSALSTTSPDQER